MQGGNRRLPPPPPPPEDNGNQQNDQAQPQAVPAPIVPSAKLQPRWPLKYWRDMEELMSFNYLALEYYGNFDNFPTAHYRDEVFEILKDEFAYCCCPDVKWSLHFYNEHWAPTVYVLRRGIQEALRRREVPGVTRANMTLRKLRGDPLDTFPALPFIDGDMMQVIQVRTTVNPRRVEYGTPVNRDLLKEMEWMREIRNTPVWERIEAAGRRGLLAQLERDRARDRNLDWWERQNPPQAAAAAAPGNPQQPAAAAPIVPPPQPPAAAPIDPQQPAAAAAPGDPQQPAAAAPIDPQQPAAATEPIDPQQRAAAAAPGDPQQPAAVAPVDPEILAPIAAVENPQQNA